jgi:hypothetical protein
MPDDGYELFRRAVVERDADAWAAIAARYRHLLIAWAARCQAVEAAREPVENLADEALARACTALAPERFAAFPSLAALLGYLRTCVVATVIDAARSRAAYERVFQYRQRDDGALPEQIVLERFRRAELWQLVASQATTEAERVALYERFVLDLRPRSIQARHPALFSDVMVVYTVIRNVCARLRRHKGLRQLYAEHHTM